MLLVLLLLLQVPPDGREGITTSVYIGMVSSKAPMWDPFPAGEWPVCPLSALLSFLFSFLCF